MNNLLLAIIVDIFILFMQAILMDEIKDDLIEVFSSFIPFFIIGIAINDISFAAYGVIFGMINMLIFRIITYPIVMKQRRKQEKAEREKNIRKDIKVHDKFKIKIYDETFLVDRLLEKYIDVYVLDQKKDETRIIMLKTMTNEEWEKFKEDLIEYDKNKEYLKMWEKIISYMEKIIIRKRR